MTFTCPACGHQRDFPERAHGRKFLCSACKAKIRHLPDGRFELVEETTSPDLLTSFDTPAPGATPAVCADPSVAGRTLGNYRLISPIGKGGHSQVYLAEHQSLHRRMAVKLLSPAAGSAPAARLAGEAASLARVDHPNVVRVYDFGTEEGTTYLAMEYVDGPSLEDVIRKKGPLDVDTLIKAAADILGGLEVIHGAGILHRDIKPSNVLFHRDGRAAVADFGLAREIPPEDTPPSDIFSGTADYAAPELAVGRPPNVRTDLYALGATLYKAATGQVPFPGASAKEKLNKQLYEPLVPPRQLNPKIPEALETLIVSLLHKEPQERPSSARDSVARLQQAASRQAVTATGPGGRPRAAWELIAGVTAGALLLAAVVLFFGLRGDEKPKPVMRSLDLEPAPAVSEPSTARHAVPSVLQLTQGSFVAGLVEEAQDAYRVLVDGREFIVQKRDVLHWHRTSAGMAAEAEKALHEARELYLNSRELTRKADALAMLTESEGKFADARDGFITARKYFSGSADGWLDGRLLACQEGLGLIRVARGSVLAAAPGDPARTTPEPVPRPLPPPEPAPKPIVEPKPPPKPVVPEPPGGETKQAPVPGRKLDPRIVNALVWLGRHQNADGSWRIREYTANCAVPGSCGGETGHSDFNVGVTGLALVSILGTGIGVGDNDTYFGVNVGEAVRRGLAYLVRIQSADGALGPVDRHKHIYNQALATFALAEGSRSSRGAGDGFAASADAIDNALGRAVNFLVYAQNPGKGWRYSVQPGDNDSSVTALCLLALEAARRARASVPTAAFRGGLAWFDEATEPAYGRVGYTHAGTGKVFIPGQNENFHHHETLAAAAWVCRAEISNRRVSPPLSITQILHNDRPQGGDNSRDAYYWYYGTRYFKLVGGKDLWERWQRAVLAAIEGWQDRGSTSCSFGSWPPTGRWSPEGGRVYTTAMNLLTLEYALLRTPFRFPARAGVPGDAPPEPEYAWTFHLKSGGRIRAVSYEEEGGGYRLKIRGGTTYVGKGEVEKITKVGE